MQENKVMETKPRSSSLHNNRKDRCQQYKCKRFWTNTNFSWRSLKYQTINQSNKNREGNKSILFFVPTHQGLKLVLMFCIIPGKVA